MCLLKMIGFIINYVLVVNLFCIQWFWVTIISDDFCLFPTKCIKGFFFIYKKKMRMCLGSVANAINVKVRKEHKSNCCFHRHSWIGLFLGKLTSCQVCCSEWIQQNALSPLKTNEEKNDQTFNNWRKIQFCVLFFLRRLQAQTIFLPF